MAILLPYMVGGEGGRGPPSLIHENVCHVCDFISATSLGRLYQVMTLCTVVYKFQVAMNMVLK